MLYTLLSMYIVCGLRERERERERERGLCMYILCVGVCWGESKRKRETCSKYLLCGDMYMYVCMCVYL